MLDKLIGLAARLTVVKKLLEAIHATNTALSGHRSEILLGLEALLYVLKNTGVIPHDMAGQADALAAALLGALPVTLAEKVKRVQDLVNKAAPTPAGDAPAQN